MGICQAEMEIEKGEDVRLGPKQKFCCFYTNHCTACRRSGMCFCLKLSLRETSIDQVDGRGREEERSGCLGCCLVFRLQEKPLRQGWRKEGRKDGGRRDRGVREGCRLGRSQRGDEGSWVGI